MGGNEDDASLMMRVRGRHGLLLCCGAHRRALPLQGWSRGTESRAMLVLAKPAITARASAMCVHCADARLLLTHASQIVRIAT